MSNFFEDISTQEYTGTISNEVAILQEKIILPQKCQHKWQNTIGKFFIPILFPLVEEGSEAIEKTHKAPSTKHIVCSGFMTKSYLERNFIRLMTPKHLFPSVALWNGEYWYIPKKTRFIITFIGGSTLAADIKVIGVIV